jgi:hypothetical protein
MRALLDKACAQGGIGALGKQDQDKFSLLLSALSLYQHAVSCQDWESAAYYKGVIDDINGKCPQASTPQAINTTPRWNAAQWTTIPNDQYQNGYTPSGASPLQFRAVNGILHFRGQFTGNAYAVSGFTLVDPDYWTNLGIGLWDRVAISIVDAAATGSPQGCVGYARAVSNDLKVYFVTGIDPSAFYQFTGSIPFI